MDILDHMRAQPLFGGWRVTRLLEQKANQALFEMEHKEAQATQKAILRAVFIPRRRSGVRELMQQMEREQEPAAFLQGLVDAVKQELLIRERLQGQPRIVTMAEQKILEREDKSGIEVLMRLEYLTPLDLYLQRRQATEEIVLRIGADLCKALESCHRAGICHGNVCADAVFAAPDGTFKLGRFEKASMPGADHTAAGDAAAARGAQADVRALGALLRQLAQQTAGPLTPEFAALMQSTGRAGGGADDLERLRKGLEQLAFSKQQHRANAGPVRRAPLAPATAQSGQDPAAAVPLRVKPPLEPEQTRPAVPPETPAQAQAAEQKKALLEKAAEEYAVQGEQEASAPRNKVKTLCLIAGAALCLAALVFAGVRFALPAIRDVLSAAGSADADQAAAEPTPPAEAGQDDPEAAGPAEPTPSPEELEAAARDQRIQQVLSTMQDICTGAQPQVTDPATWNEAGKALMARLEADPYYQEWGFTANAAAFAAADSELSRRGDMAAALSQWQEGGAALADQYPYLIAVNRAASTVTVYTPDEEGRYTVPYMAMVCSGGPGTPTGFWFTPIRYQWRTLVGPCYGQNATRIYGSYLFHSVPYYTQHKDDVEYDQYNQLGTQASLGCIRLAVVDVKWIFDNCPLGTPVVIYDDENDPGPMGKPGTIYTDPANTEMRGWDPTDPDPANPWGDEYLPGTAIRSDAAWADYAAAMADGRWNATINVTDLRGESTDSTVEGTRG